MSGEDNYDAYNVVEDDGGSTATIVITLVMFIVIGILGGLVALHFHAQKEGLIDTKPAKPLTNAQKKREAVKASKRQQRMGKQAE